MKSNEITMLRTKLREVNIEYSALVRGKAGVGRFVRMGDLREERNALLALIAEERGLKSRVRPSLVMREPLLADPL